MRVFKKLYLWFLGATLVVSPVSLLSTNAGHNDHNPNPCFSVINVEGTWIKDRIGRPFMLQTVAMQKKGLLQATFNPMFQVTRDTSAFDRGPYFGEIRKVGCNKFTTTALILIERTDGRIETHAFEGILTFLDEKNIKIVWGDPINGPNNQDFLVLEWPSIIPREDGNNFPEPRVNLPDIPFTDDYIHPFSAYAGRPLPDGPGYVEFYRKVPHPRSFANY